MTAADAPAADLETRLRELVTQWRHDEETHLGRFGQHLPATLLTCIEHVEDVLEGKDPFS